MAFNQRTKKKSYYDPWPGFVDVLSTLLMVVIFVLMVFAVAQFTLNQLLNDKDKTINTLGKKLSELEKILSIEQKTSTDLKKQIQNLTLQLDDITSNRNFLNQQLTELKNEKENLSSKLILSNKNLDDYQNQLKSINKEFIDTFKIIDVNQSKIEMLVGDIVTLKSMRDELAKNVLNNENNLNNDSSLPNEASIQFAILNQQILLLRKQLQFIQSVLDTTEQKLKDKDLKIEDLGTKLNIALANKINELARYRSDFFGKLRDVIGERMDIHIVGDRFVFQSEVLFESGSADLQSGGQEQLQKLAKTLLNISQSIPSDIDWILRVDGHTDKRPIETAQFHSNWELSTARAISVVQYLITQGIPENRLAAAGFAEFRPLEKGDDEISLQHNRRIELKLDQR
ncbi:MAG: peptidoglycan -binding protein [Alphaproteobacteria bacterium]|nr:peptidoglycan -binding protein [Alphaproteobacteria bacterium]